MRKSIFIAIVSIFLMIFLEGIPFSESTKNFQYKKQPEIQQIKPNKPVKIKLKRSVEGKYSWDLSGDNVDEVVRADKRLKKLLKIE
jgi:uncharacterized membrane protein